MSTSANTNARIRPSLGIALGIVVAYMAILVVLQLISGVDFDDVAASASNVVRIIVIPVGIGSVLLFAVWRYLGWGRPVIAEVDRDKLPAWGWVPPALVGVTALLGLVQADWGSLEASFILAVVVGTLLVGFSEELLARGLLLHAARHRFSTEFQVAVVTSVVFGLMHAVNILTGQAVGATLQQAWSAGLSGVAFYLMRRMSGTLVASMLLHAVFDASLFLQGEVRAPADDATLAGQIPLLVSFVLQIAIVVSLFLLWRQSRSRGEPAPA